MILTYEQLKDKIKHTEKLYIYGAGIVAYGASEAVCMLCDKKVEAFLVTDPGQNNAFLAGIPVRQVAQDIFNAEHDSFVLIATPEEYHGQIEAALHLNGCSNYACLTSKLEYRLMGEYLKKGKGIRCIEDMAEDNCKGCKCTETDVRVYMAVSHNDKVLKNSYQDESFVRRIQVGTALTDQALQNVQEFDNTADHISLQNPLYGEFTATYWAWKNDMHDIMGLFHYRRVLNVTEEQIGILKAGEADVILPLPFVCYPDTSGQYGRYLRKEDIQIMWDVLKNSHPAMYKAAVSVLKDRYLYNYNILIARREVYEDYCEWMFPMLEEIAVRCEAVSGERMSRYIGRIGEVLTSIYFLVNNNEWNIVHAEKVWRI